MKDLSRREALAAGAGAVVITLLPLKAYALSEKSMKDVEMFTGGGAATESDRQPRQAGKLPILPRKFRYGKRAVSRRCRPLA